VITKVSLTQPCCAQIKALQHKLQAAQAAAQKAEELQALAEARADTAEAQRRGTLQECKTSLATLGQTNLDLIQGARVRESRGHVRSEGSQAVRVTHCAKACLLRR